MKGFYSIGGNYDIVDNCDLDKMSIVQLNEIVKDKLSYNVRVVYYMKVLGRVDLQYFEIDAQLMNNLDYYLTINRLVEIYYDVQTKQIGYIEQQGIGEDIDEDEPRSLDYVGIDYEQSEEKEMTNAEIEKNLIGLTNKRQ